MARVISKNPDSPIQKVILVDDGQIKQNSHGNYNYSTKIMKLRKDMLNFDLEEHEANHATSIGIWYKDYPFNKELKVYEIPEEVLNMEEAVCEYYMLARARRFGVNTGLEGSAEEVGWLLNIRKFSGYKNDYDFAVQLHAKRGGDRQGWIMSQLLKNVDNGLISEGDMVDHIVIGAEIRIIEL